MFLKRKLHLKFQPTSSGKTQLIKRFLESRGSICSYPRNHTIIFYSHWQDAYVEMKNKSLVDEFVQGMWIDFRHYDMAWCYIINFVPIYIFSLGYPGLEGIMQMIEPYKSKEGTLLIFDGISWIVFYLTMRYQCNIFFQMAWAWSQLTFQLYLLRYPISITVQCFLLDKTSSVSNNLIFAFD